MIAKTETLDGCKVLRVSGRIDFESALDFEHHINAMIQGTGDCYIIELSQVELLSSAGLRVMLSTAKRVTQRNASLALAAPSQVVRQVFEISHFNLLFKIYPSIPAAIAALKGTIDEAELEETAHESIRTPVPTGQREMKATIPPAQAGEPSLDSLSPEKSEAAPLGPLPTALESSTKIEPALPLPPVVSPPPVADAPPINVAPPPVTPQLPATSGSQEMPPPLPSADRESISAAAATAVPQAQQVPPPLPPVHQSNLGPSGPTERPVVVSTRREAKYPALLEVRAEGTSYPCKDGDVIGTEGKLAQAYFSQITNLAPRHLLIGQLDGRWFVFTPKNVQHPFILDGVVLRSGERKILQYVEHQAEFSGHVFGFRLVADEPKENFFSRLFRRKQ
jgi:anti-anti-sigma factor